MSAKVRSNPLGGWIGHCKECRETVSGGAGAVDFWADVHNDENHKEATK